MKMVIRMILFVVLSHFSLSQQVLASSIIFEDNFSVNNGAWYEQRNIQWINQSLPCVNNNQRASWEYEQGLFGITIDGPGCVTEISPLNVDLTGIDYQIDFDWIFSESTHMDRNFAFIWKDQNNWYDIKILDNTILVQKVVNGNYSIVPNSSVQYPFNADDVYHFTIKYRRTGEIDVDVNHNNVINTIDQGNTINGFRTFALQASVGSISYSRSYFDNVIVWSLDPAPLDVELMMQSDSRWKDESYGLPNVQNGDDQYTIGQVGCAMTSGAMVLNYHGYDMLPDGVTQLNPSTLNEWLKANQGYMGNATSYPTIASLTQQISTSRGSTSKLEYVRHLSGLTDTAHAAITASLPAIFEVPGHFVVGNGIIGDDDYSIKDPANPFTQFSELARPMTTVRTFTPANSDLSYFEIVTPAGIQASLFDEDNNLVEGNYFDDSLLNQETGELTAPTVNITEIAKPSDGEYTIHLANANGTAMDFLPTTVTLRSFDKQGALTTAAHAMYPSDNIRINYEKKGIVVSELDTVNDSIFTNLHRLIAAMWVNGEIQSETTYQALNTALVDASMVETRRQHQDALTAIKRIVVAKESRNSMTADAQLQLQAELLSIHNTIMQLL